MKLAESEFCEFFPTELNGRHVFQLTDTGKGYLLIEPYRYGDVGDEIASGSLGAIRAAARLRGL